MPSLSLQTAMASYGHTKQLIEGTVNSDRIVIEHVPGLSNYHRFS